MALLEARPAEHRYATYEADDAGGRTQIIALRTKTRAMAHARLMRAPPPTLGTQALDLATESGCAEHRVRREETRDA